MATESIPRDSTTDDVPESGRRREILLAAINLFRERGYHATGMTDIGAAVDLTGPALYRHFESKEAILETALLNAARYMENKVATAIDAGSEPAETLQRLIADLVRTVLDYPAVTAIAITERRHMSDRAKAIYDRSTRLRAAEWVGPLKTLRPDLTETEARLRVRCAQDMLAASLLTPSQLGSDATGARLEAAARAILLDAGGRLMPPQWPADADDDVPLTG